MSHRHHSAIGVFALVAAIAFAFGHRTARIIVSAVLLLGVAFFVYITFRIVMGTI